MDIIICNTFDWRPLGLRMNISKRKPCSDHHAIQIQITVMKMLKIPVPVAPTILTPCDYRSIATVNTVTYSALVALPFGWNVPFAYPTM